MTIPHLSISPALGLGLPPAVGLALLFGQVASDAVAMAGDASGFGILRLVTETVVGVSILATVILFLRAQSQDRKERQEHDAALALALKEHDGARDAALRQIAADFREDVERFAERTEANQRDLISLSREFITVAADLNHTVKALADRHERLEHHVFMFAPGVMPGGNELPAISRQPETPKAP